jgi:hydrogenase small subunit
MNLMNRRSFLELGARLGALMGVGAGAIPRLALALEHMASGAAPVLWLQGQSCSGCSVSLLNGTAPGPAALLTQYIQLVFHQTISAATGQAAVAAVDRAIAQGGYLLCVEGAVPAGMPKACQFGGEVFGTQVLRAAQNAKAVIAVGTCAAFGGIPAAEGNPTGAVSVPEHFNSRGIKAPTIRLPGCPPHPEWLLGTLTHILSSGLPPLDAQGRPRMFFDRLLHDMCPRFADYERERFAQSFGEPGCLFKLGCLGPITHADCTVRLWNGGINSCITAGAPCAGCAGPEFAAKTKFPFLTRPSANSAGQH